MKTRGIVLVAVVFALVAGMAAVGWIMRPVNDAADPVELAREREQNRLEAAAAFKEPTPPSSDDVKTFAEFLNAFGENLRAGNAEAIINYFAVERMVSEAARQGLNLGPGSVVKQRGELATGIRTGLGPALAMKKD